MPSRRYGTSEGSSSSPMSSSLRRLSSLASFNTLNPFHRRRSNVTTAESAATSSTANLCSPTTSNNEACEQRDLLENVPESVDDRLAELPTPHNKQHISRRSYICLPDEAPSGIPRSRTFSNLPIPTRANHTGRSVHSRDRSRVSSHQLPTTRLPSPTGSTRKYSSARFATSTNNNEPKRPCQKSRMKRSETEPLLPVFETHSAANTTGRSTAFKENLSPGPARPLPSSLSSQTATLVNERLRPSRGLDLRRGPSVTSSHAFHSDSSGLPSSPYRSRFISGQGTEASSSPLKQIQEVAVQASASNQTHSKAMQRWNSQPVLTSTPPNIQHEVVEQKRLLSVRHPLTPEPAKHLAIVQATAAIQPKKENVPNSTHVDMSATEVKKRDRPVDPATPERLTDLIDMAKPMAWWCGRFSSLNDRYKNEELIGMGAKSRSEGDNMHNTAANLRRMRRVLEHIHSLCVTDDAKYSFLTFQTTLAAIMKIPDLVSPLPGQKQGYRGGMQSSVGSNVSSPLSAALSRRSDGRKTSLIDRLFARTAKNRKSIG